MKLGFAVGFLTLSASLAGSDTQLTDAAPFMVRIPPSQTQSNTGELQFAGVTSFGQDVLISLYNSKTQRSHWYTVGESFDGFTVESYSPITDSIVVKSTEKEFALHLRAASSFHSMEPNQSPATGAIPTAAPSGSLEDTKAKNEHAAQEARLLVQDLLEIGVKQRADYEAKQKAATPATKDIKP